MTNTLLNATLIATLSASIGIWILRLGLAESEYKKHVISWLILFTFSQLLFQLFSFWNWLAIIMAFFIPLIVIGIWEKYHLKSFLFKFLKWMNITIDDDAQNIQERYKKLNKKYTLHYVTVYLKNGLRICMCSKYLQDNYKKMKKAFDIFPHFEYLPSGDLLILATHCWHENDAEDKEIEERDLFDSSNSLAVLHIKKEEFNRVEIRYTIPTSESE